MASQELGELFDTAGVPKRRHGEHHHSRPGWISIDCPQCSPGSNRFRLGFKPATGQTFCWVCGRLDGVEIIARLCGVSLRQAADCLRQNQYVFKEEPDKKPTRLVLPKSEPLGVAHREYLTNRGFNPDEIVDLWGISGIGFQSVKLKWRILIPIRTRAGRVVSWTTRAISPTAELRYISAGEEEEEVKHKEILYGADLAGDVIVVCEGPISAWGIGPGGVATCGLGYTEAQLHEISKYPTRVVCFDATDEAQRRADQLCRDLSCFPGITENVELETGKDPAEASKDEIREIREKYFG